MFSCTACKPADPTSSTVKVNPALIGSDKENMNHQQLQSVAEMEAKKRVEQERQEQERAAREREAREKKAREQAEQREALRREQERKEVERREAEEAERRQREAEAIRQRMAAEAAAAEAARKKQEKEQEEEAQREKERLEQERARKEREDNEKVVAFLVSKGYGEDVNAKRKTFRKHYYPLHDAVAAHDAELIRVLLAAGADPALRSSSGKTPLERAQKWNTDGSLDQVCSLLEGAAVPIAAH
mmetsp:Transcript_43249/g.78712  ORF Transcript_43249/g.78712 Transcript_43249/m.78712 type:complete len:244 (+) Transcript_43249:102-833(+)